MKMNRRGNRVQCGCSGYLCFELLNITSRFLTVVSSGPSCAQSRDSSMEEKWVEMNGKIVPIMKLERLARDDLDYCQFSYEFWLQSNSPSRKEFLRRWLKFLVLAEKKLEQILSLKATASSLQPPFRVKEAPTDICESSDSELIPPFFL